MPRKKYAFEFWAIPKFVAEDKRLKPLDKIIVGIFVTRWNGENEKEIKAKYKTIARETGMSIKSVRRSIDRLKKLSIIEGKQMGQRLANRYKLNI